MIFDIRLGVPEIETFWNTLLKKNHDNALNKDELKLFKKLLKCFRLLSSNPMHNSLHTHEIAVLSKRYGLKVWQSYLENNKRLQVESIGPITHKVQ